MKKSEKIWLLMLIFLAVFSFCMLIVFEVQGAEIHGNVQVGYVPEVESFEAEINLQFIPWHWVSLYGGISVLMEHREEMKFSPYRNVYITGAKVNIIENLYVDLYHHCAHMVIYDYKNQFYDKFADGNKTRISVGIEW